MKTALRERLAVEHLLYADESGHSDVGEHIPSKVRAVTRSTYAEIVANYTDSEEGALALASYPQGDLLRYDGSGWKGALSCYGRAEGYGGNPVAYCYRYSSTEITGGAYNITAFSLSGGVRTAYYAPLYLSLITLGAGGVDVLPMTSNSWYYIWVIGRDDGTWSCMASLASDLSSVTLPSGYVYGALVGAFYYVTSNIRYFRSPKRGLFFVDLYQVLSSGNSQNEGTVIPIPAGYVAPIADSVLLDIYAYCTTAALRRVYVYSYIGSKRIGTVEIPIYGSSSFEALTAEIPLNLSGNINYHVSGGNTYVYMKLLGWRTAWLS